MSKLTFVPKGDNGLLRVDCNDLIHSIKDILYNSKSSQPIIDNY